MKYILDYVLLVEGIKKNDTVALTLLAILVMNTREKDIEEYLTEKNYEKARAYMKENTLSKD